MAKIWGQLENAQIENKSSDYSAGPVGRIWWNTSGGQAKLDDGTNIRALLRNDSKAIIGNSGTASQNIRLHRGAAGVLQFVQGSDVTAEGSLSTAINQISGRAENYTTAALPAAGNAGRIAWNTTTSTLNVDNGSSWQDVSPTRLTSSIDALNYSITCSVGASALTIALKTAAGSDPSAGDPVKISFRNATAATGDSTQVSATAATSLVISSGSTLGHSSGVNEYIYVYALNNSGTIELAASTTLFDEGSVASTTAEGGAGAADSRTVLYSTTARSSKAIRLIARLKSNQTAAGTYSAVPTEISLKPWLRSLGKDEIFLTGGNGHGSTNTKIRRFTTTVSSISASITLTQSSTNGDSFTINDFGFYIVSYVDRVSAGSNYLGLSKNSTELTTNIQSITNADRLLNVVTAGVETLCSVGVWLAPGDVIRAHTDGGVDGSSNLQVSFRIARVI